jgi:thioredoxin reductase (NADPH)
VVEAEAFGGQAGTSAMIRNYLGFPRGITGRDLALRAAEQSRLFGVQAVYLQKVNGLRREGGRYAVSLTDRSSVTAAIAVIAIGVTYRRLRGEGIERLTGAGVFYGSAPSMAQAMKGLRVVVAGAGNSAGQAAVHLARFAAEVMIVAPEPSLTDNMSDYLIRQVGATPNIVVRLRTEVVDAIGGHRLEGVKLRDLDSGTMHTVPAAALFVMIGARPATSWLPPEIQRDPMGYILTGQDVLRDGKAPAGWPLQRQPFPRETSLPGVFAVGDVRHEATRRVASAVGDGAIAVQMMHEYLKFSRPQPSTDRAPGSEATAPAQPAARQG